MTCSRADATQDELEHLQGSKNEQKVCSGVRYLQVVILFLCLTMNYIMRINLSIAMVVMTDTNRTDTSYPVYDWSAKEKGVLFSAFFWGYLIMNLIASVLVTRLNNKTLLLISVTYSSIATILTPFVVKWGGLYAFIALRVSIGVMQGVMMPSVTGQMARWIPTNERARCGNFVLGGMQFGTIVSYVSSGVLASSAGGWPSIFYVSGGLSLVWAAVWYEWGAESPATCSYIKQSERKYIEESLIHTTNNRHREIPWAKIMTNKACYAVLVATAANSWGFWILVSQMPTFFSSVLHFDATNNGLVSAMPYVCLWVVSFPVSYIADSLIKKGVTSVTFSRKFCTTIGLWGPAAFLAALAYTNDSTEAIIMYTIGVTLNCFVYMGYNINLLDICPNFSGLLMGITNGLSTVSAILGPIFVGYVVYDDTNADLWKIVFNVSAAVFFLGNILFLFCGSGEVQPFNDAPVADDDLSDPENGKR